MSFPTFPPPSQDVIELAKEGKRLKAVKRLIAESETSLEGGMVKMNLRTALDYVRALQAGFPPLAMVITEDACVAWRGYQILDPGLLLAERLADE